MDKMICYDNEWFTGAHYIKEGGHYAFAIYGYIQYQAPYSKNITTSLDDIATVFGMGIGRRLTLSKLKDAIKFLQQKGMVELYTEHRFKEVADSRYIDTLKGKSSLYIKIKNEPKERYTLIKYEEFEKILFEEDITANLRVELMCYFSAIIFHINDNTKICFPAINLLNSEACVGKDSTCTTHNKRLVDMKLIAYKSVGYTHYKTGEQLPYHYSRPEHALLLQAEIEAKRAIYRVHALSQTKTDIVNEMRRQANKITKGKQKLERMEQDGISLDAKTVHDVQIAETMYEALTTRLKELNE